MATEIEKKGDVTYEKTVKPGPQGASKSTVEVVSKRPRSENQHEDGGGE